MNVYIVFSHDRGAYPTVNTIEYICLTQNIAKEKVEQLEKAQSTFSIKVDYWHEEYNVETGSLLISNDGEKIMIDLLE